MPTDIKVNTGAADIVCCCSLTHRDSDQYMAAAAISLKCLTIPPVAKHTATVVFVHVSISLLARVSPFIVPSFLGLR